MSDKKKRLDKLEAKVPPPPATPPRLVIIEPGETTEQAIFRVYGVAGLPPSKVPHLIIVPVSPVSRRDNISKDKQHD